MPEVSVIVPSYNHARFIRKAVESVLTQTLTDLELIVVDDGSEDDSLQILSKIQDPRIIVLPQSNQGAHQAINRGLHRASGKYLAILNSDDYYHPERLEKTCAILKIQPDTGLVASYIQIIDQADHPLGIKHGFKDCEPWMLGRPDLSFRATNDLKEALLTENYLATTSNFIFPKALYEQIGDFRPLRFTHDWDYALRLTQISDLALLTEPLLNYRVHPDNTIRKDQSVMIFEICWILAVHLPTSSALNETDFGLHKSSSGSGWQDAGSGGLRTSDRDTVVAKRIEQLLHSIYTFQCEQVLIALLLQKLHLDEDLALSLLAPVNPIREKYLDFIRTRLRQSDLPVSSNKSMLIEKAWATARKIIGH